MQLSTSNNLSKTLVRNLVKSISVAVCSTHDTAANSNSETLELAGGAQCTELGNGETCLS